MEGKKLQVEEKGCLDNAVKENNTKQNAGILLMS